MAQSGDKQLSDVSWTPYVTYTSNYSKVIQTQVRFTELGGGIFLPFGFSAGFNYQYLNSELRTRYLAQNEQDRININLSYASLVGGFTLYQIEKITFRLEMAAGLGSLKRKHTLPPLNKKNNLAVLEPAMELKYMILDWLSITGKVGKRWFSIAGQPKGSDFSSTKINLGFSIAPVPMYHAIKNKTLFN